MKTGLLSVTLVASIGSWLLGAPAIAQARPSDRSASAEAEDANSERNEKKEKKNELTVLPLLGGDTDVGFGGGYLGSFARVDPKYEPYLYRIESTGYATFRGGDDGLEVPYVDAYLLLDLPHVIHERLKLQLRVSYTKESALHYFGLGNASQILPDFGLNDPIFKHERVHPTFRVNAEYWMTDRLSVKWGMAYTYNTLKVLGDTLLARDLYSQDPKIRRLLGDTRAHGVAEFSYGLQWDTRDDEVSARRGQYHALRIDLAPGGTEGVPYRWARANASFRFYVPVTPRRVTLAARVLTDWLFGDPPFYELPRYDATSAIGGVHGVRGIPAQRYYGKIKVISNLELRSELFDFDFWNKKNTFGVAVFADSGRVWTELDSNPELDGSGLGLKYGLGAGIRLRAGKSFVLRLDAAWSEDARPLAGYLSAGQLF
jgi:hypothetical protein